MREIDAVDALFEATDAIDPAEPLLVFLKLALPLLLEFLENDPLGVPGELSARPSKISR